MIFTSVTMIFLDEQTKQFIYPVAFFIGASQALVLNTSIALISEVIGVKGSSGAFVFGFYSFFDKFSGGIALFTITILPGFSDSVEYIRWVTVLVPLISGLVAWIFVLVQKTKETQEKTILTG